MNSHYFVRTLSRKTKQQVNIWAKTLSYASLNCDFSSSDRFKNELRNDNDGRENRAYSVSYATPFSDYVKSENNNSTLTPSMKSQLRHAENDEKSYKNTFSDRVQADEHERADMAYSLSYAAPFSDFASGGVTIPSWMKTQLKHAENNNKYDEYNNNEADTSDSALPHTLEEALESSPQARVITKTNAPFEIVDVNTAWEGLCGFSREEAVGKTLEMLQGPETDPSAVTALMSTLMRGEEAGTVLTNYNKDGRKFQNRLRVAPLRENSDGTGKLTHFVGVLLDVGGNDAVNRKHA